MGYVGQQQQDRDQQQQLEKHRQLRQRQRTPNKTYGYTTNTNLNHDDKDGQYYLDPYKYFGLESDLVVVEDTKRNTNMNPTRSSIGSSDYDDDSDIGNSVNMYERILQQNEHEIDPSVSMSDDCLLHHHNNYHNNALFSTSPTSTLLLGGIDVNVNVTQSDTALCTKKSSRRTAVSSCLRKSRFSFEDTEPSARTRTSNSTTILATTVPKKPIPTNNGDDHHHHERQPSSSVSSSTKSMSTDTSSTTSTSTNSSSSTSASSISSASVSFQPQIQVYLYRPPVEIWAPSGWSSWFGG